MKRIFCRVLEYLLETFSGEKRTFNQPLWGLSDDEIKQLRAWRSEEAFDVFTRLLDTAVNIHAENILKSRDATAIHESRGFILGLRQAASLVDESLQAHEQLAAARRADAERGRFSGDALDVSTFGSPSWRRNGE